MLDAIVVGGGITGLTIAYKLRQQGKRIIVFEPGQIGGIVQTAWRDECVIEEGPSVFVEKPAFGRLIDELELRDSVVYPKSTNFSAHLWYRNRIEAFPDTFFRFLTTPLLPLWNKVRILRNLLSSRINFSRSEDQDTAAFMRRIIGGSAVKRILQPFLKGVFGEDCSRLSARSVFPELWNHCFKGESLVQLLRRNKRPDLMAFKGGNHILIKRLVDKVGIERIVQGKVHAVTKDPSGVGFEISAGDCMKYRARSVYLATSGDATAGVIRLLLPDLAQRLALVKYASLMVVHCLTDVRVPVQRDAFGIAFPNDDTSKLIGVMFNSELFPHMSRHGKHLLSAVLRGWGSPSLWSVSDTALKEIVKGELRSKLGIDNCECVSISKWERAIPQYEVGHYRLVEEVRQVEKEIPGLYFVGVDLGGIAVSDRIRTAFEAVDRAA